MSSSGTEYVANEKARNYLNALLRKLVDDIELNFAARERHDAYDFVEDYGEYIIIPSIDILITLCERYQSFSINIETAKSWREMYLKSFDEHVAMQPGYIDDKRRKAIVATFDRLDAIAQGN